MSRTPRRARVPAHLRALADAAGVVLEYVDGIGVRRAASAAALVRVLASLGHDASTPHRARAALAGLRSRSRDRLLPPVGLVVSGRRPPRLALRWKGRARAAVPWTLVLRLEDGARIERSGRTRPERGELRIPLPGGLPEGYHDLRVEARPAHTAEPIASTQRLIVAPGRCETPRSRGVARGAGLLVNLYAVRAGVHGDAGIGDLGTLDAITAFAARGRLDFVGLNPLHAIRNEDAENSPYGPISRLYRNWIYIDPERVPERTALPRALRDKVRAGPAGGSARSVVDYEGVARLRRRALRVMHRAFLARALAAPRSSRARAFARYADREGADLDAFATFCALEEVHGSRGIPRRLRDPRSRDVARFRRAHARQVSFHAWLQFELDRQLADVAARARRRGLRLGLYHDLAIGVRPDGADPWSRPQLFARGMSLGAPPDGYARTGQVWGLAPFLPDALREDGYRAFGRMLRANLRHAGILRIDHVIGFVRQFWVPRGRPGTEGVLVRFPAEELLAVVALESRRAGAIIVGEDLGTIPPELPALLARFELLSSRVLVFERDARGAFRAPSAYPARALASLNTHDLPPMAGWITGAELPIRRALGLLKTRAELDRALEGRAAEVRALVDALRAARLLRRSGAPVTADVVRACCAFLGRTRAALAAVFLDDVALETRPVNVPTATNDRWPCWSRRMARTLETLDRDRHVRTSLAALVASRRARGT